MFQAGLTRPVIAIDFEGLESGALEGVPETSRDQEGAEVKAKVLAVGKCADPNRLDAHDTGLCRVVDCQLMGQAEDGSVGGQRVEWLLGSMEKRWIVKDATSGFI